MRAGELRERVDIQARAATPDGLGGQDETWTTKATVWAQVKGLRGEERVVAASVSGSVTHQVTLRAPRAVTEADRLLWRGLVLEIVSPPITDERRTLLVLLCKESSK